MRYNVRRAMLMLALLAGGCSDDAVTPEGPEGPQPVDPGTAPRAVIDRFSDTAGHLFVRSADASLPSAGVAIDFDREPFITRADNAYPYPLQLVRASETVGFLMPIDAYHHNVTVPDEIVIRYKQTVPA